MQRRILVPVTVTAMVMFLATAGWGDVPAPPVNQSIGMLDVSLGDLAEADCRVCHDSGVPDRHHLLYGEPIPAGSLVPFPDSDGDGVPDTDYVCLSCHDSDFNVVRDCTACHSGSSPHHSTPAALARDCVACHGDLVDNYDDGHYIPTYEPSLVTPRPSDGNGLPANSRGTLAGGCDYCHDDDGLDPPMILGNRSLHHGTGLTAVSGACNWCHDFDAEDDETIRTCEQCHGPDSLHNIQADSPNAANIGTVVVGGEDAGYGHVGRDAGPGDSDCWGCHGFGAASAPQTGPIIPSIQGSDLSLAKAGADTLVSVGGSGFTNVAGEQVYSSDVLLTSAEGLTQTLTPETLLQDWMTVTIPATTDPGTYSIRAVKDRFASNPTVISVVPEVVIAEAEAEGATVTIQGSGFAGFAEGSGTSVTASDDASVEGTIVSWTDTTIVAEFSVVPEGVTVHSVFGTDTSVVTGDRRPRFMRGDSNADGKVNLSDAIKTLDYLFSGGSPLQCPDASDSDDSATVNITDAVLMLNWLFGGGDELAAPGPHDCGPDPTEDSLPTCEYDSTDC